MPMRRLGQIIDDNTVIVPISGPLLSKAEFDAQHSLYDGLKAEMVSLLRQSRSAEEVVLANPAQGLMPEWGDASESFSMKVFAVFMVI